jgi:hypothetical protein
MANNNQLKMANDRLAIALLKETNPELFKNCRIAVTPLVTDFDLLPFILEEIEKSEGKTTTENIHFVVAVFDRMYIPVQLISKRLVKKPIGLRDAYANVLGYDNPENVNSWVDIMRAYYKGHRFAEKVDTVSFTIYATFLSKGWTEKVFWERGTISSKDSKLDCVVKQMADGYNNNIAGIEAALLY